MTKTEKEITTNLLKAIIKCLPDLEHYIRIHGPDKRLKILKKALNVVESHYN